MPIISFNISDSLKRFLRRMVNSQAYKNNSYVMRDALTRLMHEKEVDGDVVAAPAQDFESYLPDLTASILISYNKLSKLEKKITRLEVEYHKSILNKFEFFHQDTIYGNYIVEDNLPRIQDFITELNAIEELQTFRYIINESEQ